MTNTPRSLWQTAREPTFIAGLVLAVLYVLPIWATPILPFTDLNAHLSVVAVMRNLADVGHLQSQTFDWGSFPLPNAFYYVTVYLLSFLFGLTVANQLFVSLYVLAFPLSFLAYLRAFDRDPRLVFFAFPLTYHWNMVFGFIDYSVALCFLLLALASSKRYADAPNGRRAIAIASWAALIFFTHLQVFLTFIYLVTFLFLLPPSRAERGAGRLFGTTSRWARFVVLLPALSLCAIWVYRNVLAPVKHGSSHRFGSVGNLGAKYDSLMVKLERLPTFVIDIFPNGDDTKVLGALALLAATSAALRWHRARHASPIARPIYTRMPEVLLAGTLALYITLPMHIRGQALIYCRFAALACLMAVATLHGRTRAFGGGAAKVILALVILVGGVHAYNIRSHVAAWSKEIGPFEEVMRSIPARTRITHMMRSERSASFSFAPMRHLNQYHVIFNEGVTQDSFARTSGRIIRYRPGRPLLREYQRLQPSGHFNEDWAADRKIARRYQYLLTQDIETRPQWGLWRLVSQRAQWAVYRSTLAAKRPPRRGRTR